MTVAIIYTGAHAEERRRLRSGYVARDAEGENEETKQPQRERVLEHIVRHHSAERMRFFGMPGARWEFERQLTAAGRPCYFIGVEWAWGVLERSKDHMPGKRPLLFEEAMRIGVLRGYSTDRAQLVWAHASSFCDLGRHAKGGKDRRRRWAEQYKGWTCCWLDFTSPVCWEVVRTLQQVGNHTLASARKVPVAVTFMLGREQAQYRREMELVSESDDRLEKRVRLLSAMLDGSRYRSFSLTDAWTYQSAAGVTMGMMLGVLYSKGEDGIKTIAPKGSPFANRLRRTRLRALRRRNLPKST